MTTAERLKCRKRITTLIKSGLGEDDVADLILGLIENAEQLAERRAATRERVRRFRKVHGVTASVTASVTSPVTTSVTSALPGDSQTRETKRIASPNGDSFVREGGFGGLSSPDSLPVSGSDPIVTSGPSLPPDLSDDQSLSARVRKVYGHYRTHHPKAAPALRPESREYRLIRQRMREGSTVEDLCKAIDGYHRSPFHCGVNDTGAKHQGLELIMRDSSHVTKGIEYADEGPRAMNGREARGHAAGQAWLEMRRGK